MKQIGTAQERKLAVKIAWSVKKRIPACVPIEDLQQAAMIGLWLAVKDGTPAEYNEHQRNRYLYLRIYGRIVDELRSINWFSRHSQGRFYMSYQPIEEGTVEHTAEQLLILDESAASAMSQLSEKQRRVVHAFMFGDKNCEQGTAMNCTDARISQILKESFSVMRKYLDAEERKVPSAQAPCAVPVE